MKRYARSDVDMSFSIFDTIRQASDDDREIGIDPMPRRWIEAMLAAGCRAVGGRKLVFENAAIGDLHAFEDDGQPMQIATADVKFIHKPKGARKERDLPGVKAAYIVMTWRLTLPMLLAIAEAADAEIVIVASFDADGSAQAAIKDASHIFRVGMSPEIQVEQFDLENEYPEESFYWLPKPVIKFENADDSKISLSLEGFTDVADMNLETKRWAFVNDWAIDPDFDGSAFKPAMQFFPAAGWPKKIHKTAPASKKFEGLQSPPFTPAERIAVQISDGRHSLHLLDLLVQ